MFATEKNLINFLRHVEADNFFGCWTWTGALGGERNYGTFAWHCDKVKYQCSAHRFSYQYYHDEAAPQGMQVDHLCENKLCVNPMHLELVTPQVNSQRRSAKITVCKQGHDLTGDNIYWTSDGHRECRECRREAVRRMRARRRG